MSTATLEIPVYKPRLNTRKQFKHNRPKPRSFNPEGPIREWRADLELGPGKVAPALIYAQNVPLTYFYDYEKTMYYLQGMNVDGTLFFRKEKPC